MLIILFCDKLSLLPMSPKASKVVSVQNTRPKLSRLYTILVLENSRNLTLNCKLLLSLTLEETFFNYGYNKEKSIVLIASKKRRIPNVFSENVFKIYMNKMLNEKRKPFSRLFFFLPSTMDRKEEINQHLLVYMR